jgi:fibronectin type 3 domain-containing protein
MEAMVGVEYGMQTGIWWGTAELARGEFVKASDGRRLGYAENRPNWTAASVYRNPQGKVQAFGGTSERQAVTTSYLFLVKDRDVYFDGYGPRHEYIMNLPGGTGYQIGQTNAEGVVNITWGDDIQPVIKGKYILVNRKSGLVAEVAGGSTSGGANIQQGKYTKKTYQQWNVTPVDTRIGGDFSYFKISNVNSGTCPDVMNFSLENGANIIAYNFISVNQQWYLEYAEDGWFYIRNRHSSNCFEVANSLTTSGANIQQWEKDGGTNQQWRFLPVDATIEFESPSAPTSLVATAHAESIRLDWTASPETDVAGYTIFSSETAGGPYNTIARNVKSTSFVDNTTTNGGTFYYVVKAVDKSFNSSGYSNEVSATVTDEKALVVHLQFDGNTKDSSINLNHSASAGDVLYAQGKVGAQAIVLNGTNTFLQLPASIANQQEITVAAWVYWNGGANWQRIFDFGNGQNEYMYLTPKMRFAIKNDNSEQKLEASALPIGTWTHIALTLGSSGVRIFVNGVLATETTNIETRSIDFKPVLNYIGRAQTSVPLFNGYIDDFIIYNYELSADEVSQVFVSGVLGSDIIDSGAESKNELSLWPIPANDFIHIKCSTEYSIDLSKILIYDIKGNLVKSNPIVNLHNTKIDVSDLTSGIYLLKITNSKETITKKIIIKHE